MFMEDCPLGNFLDLYDTSVKSGNWCIPKYNNFLECEDGNDIEIGLYKEEGGELTIEIFKNDTVILCETIKWN